MSKLGLVDNGSWIKQVWRSDPAHVDDIAYAMQIASRADYSFSDTGPGGSPYLNPPPQSCRNADIRTGLASTTNLKTGRIYFEDTEMNAQVIHIRAGVTRYNSLGSFYTTAYDSEAGQLANTGRVRGLFAGFVSTVLTVVIGVAIWPILAINFITYVASRATMKPRSKYAYLHPTMINFWRTANIVLTQFGVDDEFIPLVFEKESEQMFGEEIKTSPDDRKHLGKFFKDVFNSSGGIDMFSIATRWHRNNNARMKKLNNSFDNFAEGLEWFSSPGLKALAVLYNSASKLLSDNPKPPAGTLKAYQDRWLAIPANTPVSNTAAPNTLETSGQTSGSGAEDTIKVPNVKEDGEEKTKTWWEKFTMFAMLELDDGGAFVSFRVDDTGPSAMSLSNQTGESEVKQKFDSMVESSRNTTFNFAGGNVGDNIVANAVEELFSLGKTVISTVGNNLGLSITGALAGGANIDIPMRYTGTSANLPSMNYKIQLRVTYNNEYCRFIQLWMPLAALIGLSFTKQTGLQSYGPPPVLELYDRGRAQSRYCMVQTIAISSGEGNLSFNDKNKPFAIDVSLNLVELSPIIYAPISQGFSFDPTVTVFDEDTNFTDYIKCITGVELYKQIYYLHKLKNNLTRKLANVSNALSPAHFGAMVGSFGPARVLDLFLPGTQLR